MLKPAATEILGQGAYLTLIRDHKTGWEYAARKKNRPPVGIIAKTAQSELLLIEQYRVPLGARVIEIPAGLVGDHDPDETTETAAARELLEETGYRAQRIEVLSHGPTSAGMASEVVVLAHAHDLAYAGPAAGDGTEQITLHAIPLNAVDAWLAQRAAAGMLIDAKVYAALYFLRLPVPT